MENYTNEELVAKIKSLTYPEIYMEQLYNQNRGYIYKVCSKYKAYCEIEDLMQEAYFGLYKAVQNYENYKEVKFLTYASYWLEQTIIRYIENNGALIRVASYKIQMCNKYKCLAANFERDNGRVPSDLEMAELLDTTIEEIKCIKLYINSIKSIDESISQEDESITIADTLEADIDVENDVINNLYQDYEKRVLWGIVNDCTTPQHAEILQKKFKEGKTNKEIAESYNLSISRIDQLYNAGLRMLRTTKALKQLKQKLELNSCYYFSGNLASFKYTNTSVVENIALKNNYIENKIDKLNKRIAHENEYTLEKARERRKQKLTVNNA